MPYFEDELKSNIPNDYWTNMGTYKEGTTRLHTIIAMHLSL